jgi:broad specificity polyphosphatase/5'/3'-nucleotidase SurE
VRTPPDDAPDLHGCRAVVEKVLRSGLSADAAVLNVNLPKTLGAGARWTVTTTSTTALYGHCMTPAEEHDGSTTWSLEFLLREAARVEPGSDLAVLRHGDVSPTFLPARHGLTVEW